MLIQRNAAFCGRQARALGAAAGATTAATSCSRSTPSAAIALSRSASSLLNRTYFSQAFHSEPLTQFNQHRSFATSMTRKSVAPLILSSSSSNVRHTNSAKSSENTLGTAVTPTATPANLPAKGTSSSAPYHGLLRKSRFLLAAKPAKGKKAALAALKAKAAKSVNAAPDDVEEQHIYNIFKGKPDPVLKPDHWYPDWLHQMYSSPKLGYGDLSLMFIHGQNIEKANLGLYLRFLRLHRKLVIKVNNHKLKRRRSRRVSINL